MTRNEVIDEVRNAFAGAPRPKMFIRGTCRCDECLEHEQDMQSFSPDDLPIQKLCNPGWDPICFASNQAFAYLVTGLVTLVLEHPDEYIQQFIFHVEQPERLEYFTPSQAGALIKVMDILVLEEAAAVDNNCAVDDLFRVRNELNRVLSTGDKN